MVGLIYISMAILLFIIGAFIKWKKVTWLISGYNTAKKEEKDKYDIDKLCFYMGNFIFSLAFICLVTALFTYIIPGEIVVVSIVGMSLETLAIIIGIIYLNTNNRVMK